MNIPSDPIKWQLAQQIQAGLAKLGVESTQEANYEALSPPPNIAMGHMAFACFPYAKALRKNPAQIAKDLGEAIEQAAPVAEILPTGPYLNFRFSPEALGGQVAVPVLTGELFERKLTRDTPKTMIEYSQPNTHKELHVGHLRNMCLGDALIRLNKYCGYEIISSTFPGDVGTHVAKCLWYMKFKNQQPVPETGKGEWLGEMYSAASIKLEELKGTDEEEEAKKILTTILKQLEAGEGEYYDLWKETREWSVKLMQKVYDWVKIDFDIWYWESQVDAASVQLAKEYYEKGMLVESKGAVGMDLSDVNLGFALMLKTDGTGLYLTKDVELARRKFEDFHIERNIYVVDKRQAYHFQQVFEVLKRIGFENAENCYHLAYDFVELPDGPMASRKGNIIPLTRLINNMRSTLMEGFLAKYVGEWPEDEISNTADIISRGAIKYGMLRIDTNKKIVFEMEQWLRVDGESGPYIQYAATRINSMCEKLGYAADAPVDWTLIRKEEEVALMVKMGEFNDVVLGSCQSYQPNQLCVYLFELAKLFSSFYNAISIKNTEEEILKNTRLALARSVGTVLTRGLGLLGIEVPNRM